MSQEDLGYLEMPRAHRVGGNATMWSPSYEYLEHLIQKNPVETRYGEVLLLPIKEVTVNSKGKLCGVHGLFFHVCLEQPHRGMGDVQ